MNEADTMAEIEMCLKQITALVDLMLENDDKSIPNILTIRDLAQNGINKISIIK